MIIGEHTAIWIDQFHLQGCRCQPINCTAGKTVERELKGVAQAGIVDDLHHAGAW